MNCTRSGFTLTEVMLGILILSMGLTAACGMVMYGIRLTMNAQAKSIGIATIETVANDPSPLLPDNTTWTTSGAGTVRKGYLNGLWIERTETASTSVAGYARFVTVHVDAYIAAGGPPVASITKRLVVRP